MPLPEHGIPMVLDKVDVSMVGKKLRLVGRMLWYEPTSGLMALIGVDRAVLVDVSLCVTPKSTWVQEQLCQLIVLGHLESCEVALPMPLFPERSQTPAINPHIVLRAVIVTPDESLNISEYNAFLEEEV